MQLARPLPDAPDPHQHAGSPAAQALNPIEAIRLSLEEFFATLGVAVEFEAPLAAEGDRS